MMDHRPRSRNPRGRIRTRCLRFVCPWRLDSLPAMLLPKIPVHGLGCNSCLSCQGISGTCGDGRFS